MLRAQGLTKIYPAVAGSGGTGGDGGRGEVVLFRGLDLSVAAGEMVAVVGESGVGQKLAAASAGGAGPADRG
jgi:lipoprotein-releasing system ATP-binding protein